MNTAPGASQSELAPGGPYQLGLRGTVEDVFLGTVEVAVGSTDLRYHGVLPPDEATPVWAELRSAEHLQPEADPIDVSISAGRLVLSRVDGQQDRPCVYEVRVPVKPYAPVLAYFRFRKKTWATFQPDWCFLPDMAGMYFGVRHGSYNTGCYAFLRGGAAPAVVVGGPLQAFQVARPGQEILPTPWTGFAENSSMELFLHINTEGLAAPTNPADYPLVDVWLGGPTGLSLLARLPLGAFGEDPQRVDESVVAIFFGNSGQNGDVLELEDWAIFPMFQVVVDRGDPRGNHDITIVADSPASYRAEAQRAPDKVLGSGWARMFSGNAVLEESFVSQPGRLAVAQTYRARKVGAGQAAFYRDEPSLSSKSEGFMLEAFIAGRMEAHDGVAFGTGIEADDGDAVFRLSSVVTADGKSVYGLHIGGDPAQETSYLVLPEADFTSLKLLRLVVDRANDLLRVYVDDELTLNEQLSTLTFPPSVQPGRFGMGHLLSLNTAGVFDLAQMNAFHRFSSYEADTGVLPTAPPIQFTRDGTDGSEAVADGVYTMTKDVYGQPGTLFTNVLAYPFPPLGGAFTEFRARVREYTNSKGEKATKSTFTGVGVRLYLVTQVVDIGFYDAGMRGRMVGVLPGSGARQDLIDGTDLGRKNSAPVDWTEWHTYRVHVRPGKSLDLWVDAVVSKPAISLPWKGSFDLPDTNLVGIAFGHFSEDESSVSDWEFVRFGRSSGWDISAEQKFKNGPDDAQFSGVARMIVSANGSIDAGIANPLPAPL